MPKKRNLESLWKLVARWEGELAMERNSEAAHKKNFARIADFYSGMAYSTHECLQDLARALARLERKGKG